MCNHVFALFLSYMKCEKENVCSSCVRLLHNFLDNREHCKNKKRMLQQYNYTIRSWKTRSSVTSSFVKSTTALSLMHSTSGRLSSCAECMSVHGFHMFHINIWHYSIMLKITPLRSACRFLSISIFQTILFCLLEIRNVGKLRKISVPSVVFILNVNCLYWIRFLWIK